MVSASPSASGLKFRGWAGALTAVAGFILIPWTLGFALGACSTCNTRISTSRAGILRGIAAVAAGLIIGTGLRLLRPQRGRLAALLFAAIGLRRSGA